MSFVINNTCESDRFAFGENWAAFLKTLTDKRIIEAEKSILKSLGRESLAGMRFLDIGSGSGLFSLAAKRLGATVHSFDYDENSYNCTRFLKDKYFKEDNNWVVERGSVLDKTYLEKLGQFDIVYSWGVLHHTGDMYKAFANVKELVNPKGHLFISIYNDQEGTSRRWKKIKQLYVRSPKLMQKFLVVILGLWIWKVNILMDIVRYGNPFKSWNEYQKNRGMSAYYDLVDWIGGYPFEVAKPEEVFNYFCKQNQPFALIYLKTCSGGLGCNEYIFQNS